MAEPTVELLLGDAREQLRSLQDDSIHCVVTSPPYWGLRDYGTEPQVWGGDPDCEHDWDESGYVGHRGNRGQVPQTKWKGQVSYPQNTGVTQGVCRCGAWRGELGQEPTPDLYVEHLVEIFEVVRRVLRPDGVCFLNVDDSYVGGGGGNYGTGISNRAGGSHPTNVKNRRSFIEQTGVKAKELALVPQRLALALQAAGWYVRCDVIWNPPNAMPESVTDRPTRAHEYLYVLSKSPAYFYDGEAIRERTTGNSHGAREGDPGEKAKLTGNHSGPLGLAPPPGSMRNARSVWQIPTETFAGEHYAVMPVALATKCIKAGTSEMGCCSECGGPIRRVVERESLDRNELPSDHPEWRPGRYDNGKAGAEQSPGAGQRFSATRTLGWEPGCECGAPAVPCAVLDPFGGAMTTALAARRLGRSSVSVELSPEFAEIGRSRMETWWKDRGSSRSDVAEGQLSLVEAVSAAP